MVNRNNNDSRTERAELFISVIQIINCLLNDANLGISKVAKENPKAPDAYLSAIDKVQKNYLEIEKKCQELLLQTNSIIGWFKDLGQSELKAIINAMEKVNNVLFELSGQRKEYINIQQLEQSHIREANERVARKMVESFRKQDVTRIKENKAKAEAAGRQAAEERSQAAAAARQAVELQLDAAIKLLLSQALDKLLTEVSAQDTPVLDINTKIREISMRVGSPFSKSAADMELLMTEVLAAERFTAWRSFMVPQEAERMNSAQINGGYFGSTPKAAAPLSAHSSEPRPGSFYS